MSGELKSKPRVAYLGGMLVNKWEFSLPLIFWAHLVPG